MNHLQYKKCGSGNIKRNGTTQSGRQQYHCRACGVYTTTDACAKERAAKLKQVDGLHEEGLSQSAIARQVGISRPILRI